MRFLPTYDLGVLTNLFLVLGGSMYPFEEPGQPPLILWLQACPPLRGPDLVAAGCHASMTQDQAKDTTPITKSIFPGFSPVFKHQAKFGFDFGWMECTETIFKTCPSIIVGRSIPLGLPIGL